jgi:hypothetical protein
MEYGQTGRPDIPHIGENAMVSPLLTKTFRNVLNDLSKMGLNGENSEWSVNTAPIPPVVRYWHTLLRLYLRNYFGDNSRIKSITSQE